MRKSSVTAADRRGVTGAWLDPDQKACDVACMTSPSSRLRHCDEVFLAVTRVIVSAGCLTPSWLNAFPTVQLGSAYDVPPQDALFPVMLQLTTVTLAEPLATKAAPQLRCNSIQLRETAALQPQRDVMSLEHSVLKARAVVGCHRWSEHVMAR